MAQEPAIGESLSIEPPVGGSLSADSAAQAAPKAPTKPGVISGLVEGVLGLPQGTLPTTVETLKGLAKSAIGTVQGGGDLIRKIPYVGPALSVADVRVPINTQPSNAAQSIGKAAGDIGQFFLPGSDIEKAAQVAENVGPVARLATRAALEGASAAGISAAQHGSTEGAGTTGELTAALSALSPVLAKGAGALGQKIESVLIKSGDTSFVPNIAKYDVGGTLAQTFKKSNDRINQYMTALKQTLTTGSQQGGRVDLPDVLNRAEAQIMADPAANYGKNAAIQSAFQKWRDELGALPNGGKDADLVQANKSKQSVGDEGAWLHQFGRVSSDPDANAKELVANTIYDTLKKDIEAKAAGPAKTINKALGDLMDIRRAAAKRIPVEARQGILHLADIASILHGNFGLAVADRLLRSGRVANVLMQAGERGALPGQLPTTVGALRSRMSGPPQPDEEQP